MVGHGCGGASVSYAMEQLPQKIAKAIFVCATMVSSGQRPFDVFTEEVCYKINIISTCRSDAPIPSECIFYHYLSI